MGTTAPERITVQKGKNQVEPATVAVTAATARALREIRPDHIDPTSPVFGLTGEALANRVRAAARAAGLGDGFTGHSGRIGMARRMVAAGAPNAAVQRQGRWKNGNMVARNTRGEAAGEALKWLSLMRSDSTANKPAEAAMTDSVRPVCD